MNHCIAVFRSRQATLQFANLLRTHIAAVAIINTPNSISRACGISVKFVLDFLPIAKTLVKNFSNFAGFFAYNSATGKVSRL